MFNNPYWAPQPTMISPFSYPMMPQPPQPVVQPANTQTVQNVAQPQTTTPAIPTTWNWKAVANYQSMLMESVPFDGAPVLFMIQNEPVFYVVRMEEGRKMINGFTFTPLDNPEEATVVPTQTPEEQLKSRLTGLENNMNSIMTQLQKLVEGNHHEPIDERVNTQDNQQTKRKAVSTTAN